MQEHGQPFTPDTLGGRSGEPRREGTMVRTGDAFWRSTPIPGEPSGGHHLSVVVSSAAYNDETERPVLCALRRGSRSRTVCLLLCTSSLPRPGKFLLTKTECLSSVSVAVWMWRPSMSRPVASPQPSYSGFDRASSGSFSCPDLGPGGVRSGPSIPARGTGSCSSSTIVQSAMRGSSSTSRCHSRGASARLRC